MFARFFLAKIALVLTTKGILDVILVESCEVLKLFCKSIIQNGSELLTKFGLSFSNHTPDNIDNFGT